MRLLSTILMLCAIISCNQDTGGETHEGSALMGSWQLFERGYSPGDRYIVEEIAAEPEQLIHFNADSTFESNMEGYKIFNRFRIQEENGTLVLILSGPPNGGESRAFTMQASNQRLELRARWCIEGCHEAYRPVKAGIKNP